MTLDVVKYCKILCIWVWNQGQHLYMPWPLKRWFGSPEAIAMEVIKICNSKQLKFISHIQNLYTRQIGSIDINILDITF